MVTAGGAVSAATGVLFQTETHQLSLLHITHICAFKPGGLMSHNWLHTSACKVSNETNEMCCCVASLTGVH